MRWNDGTNWPVEAGGTCIGCASPEFWSNASPFYSRLPNGAGFGADTTAETVGVGVVVGVTALMAAHGVGKGLQAARAHEPVAASTKEAGGPPAEAGVPQAEAGVPQAEAGGPDAEAGLGGGSAGLRRGNGQTSKRRGSVVRIKIEPVTRIEGHLRIEAEVSGGKVTEAWASGTMFRGIEKIVEGCDPREACIWAQRICACVRPCTRSLRCARSRTPSARRLRRPPSWCAT